MSLELCNGMEKAPRRALYKALGLTDAELEKPLIAIVTAQSDIVPGHAHLTEITEAVKAGIYAGGCTPFVVPVIGVCDGIAGSQGLRYSLPSRELIADSVETMLIGHGFDGAVFVPNSDKAVPGMLMGAARVNIPSVFVAGGAMLSGKSGGKKVGFSSVLDGIGKVKNGTMSLDELTAMENAACSTYGNSNGIYDSGSLNCCLEALGIALPGNGTIPAVKSERVRLAKRTGLTVCNLVRDAITPKMLMTKRAFLNALTLDIALGATADTVLHLIAVAAELKITLDLDAVQKVSDATPTLCALSPYTDTDVEDLDEAGGVMAVLHELAKNNLIDGSAHTVAGEALAYFYDHTHVKDETVIHKITNPISPVGGIAVVKGNLAENGALIKRSCFGKPLQKFTGKAKCFDREEEAVEAIYSGRIKKGDVVIIRYEGPIGGPGMREMMSSSAALVGMGLGDDVVLITDGRLCDATTAAAIGNVCPEAALGGKLALVKDGDTVKIDVGECRLTLDVPAKELQARQKKLRPKDSNATGWMLRYQNLVTSAAEGAVLKKKF